jgi:hypothetical protein
MKAEGLEPAAWVNEMLAAGNKSFTLLKMVLLILQHSSKAQTKSGSR